ncbi:MAG: hypothetical protein WAN23_09200, partial [Candidatus Acidiferrales bacterium]
MATMNIENCDRESKPRIHEINDPDHRGISLGHRWLLLPFLVLLAGFLFASAPTSQYLLGNSANQASRSL